MRNKFYFNGAVRAARMEALIQKRFVSSEPNCVHRSNAQRDRRLSGCQSSRTNRAQSRQETTEAIQENDKTTMDTKTRIAKFLSKKRDSAIRT